MRNNIHVNVLLRDTKDELNYIVACIMQVNVKSASNFTRRVGQAAASKIAAAGAVTGFLGLVSAFGTAGTGTAIASLSGAAATNATLAWVGGLLGGGMALGTLMTGGLALIVGVGAYKLFASEARTYESLTTADRQVVDTCIILIKAIDAQIQNKTEPTLDEIKLVYERSIEPLYRLMKDNEKDISSRLDIKNDCAFNVNAIPDYKRNVVDRFAAYIR